LTIPRRVSNRDEAPFNKLNELEFFP